MTRRYMTVARADMGRCVGMRAGAAAVMLLCRESN